MQLNITPSVIAKITLGILIFAICVFFFDTCTHKKQVLKQSDFTDNLKNKYLKIDSLKNEKSKIPYTRTDSVRSIFWR